MPENHGIPPYSSPTALLAAARRDELLRAAAQARLAAQVPRVRRGRLRAIVGALAVGRPRRSHSTAPGDPGRAAQGEHELPVEPRSVCG